MVSSITSLPTSTSVVTASATSSPKKGVEDQQSRIQSPITASVCVVEEPAAKIAQLTPSRFPHLPSLHTPPIFSVSADRDIYKMEPGSGKRALCYHALSLIGSGSHAQVFAANDLANGKTVALKCNRRREIDENYVNSCQGLLTEEVLLRRLEPNSFTPSVLDGFYANDQERVLVLEHLERDNFLDRRFSDARPFMWPHFINIAFQLLNALRLFQQKGVIHGNLKPKKLSLDSAMQLKITGFTRGKTLSSSLKENVHVDAYSAPEVALRLDVDCKADMWSVGAIIAELAIGHPFIRTGSGDGKNQIKAIAELRGLPPSEYLNKSPTASKAFIKLSNGHYYLESADGRLYRPPDQLVGDLTARLKERWPSHLYPTELVHLTDLIDKMTAYKDRIHPLQAIEHPLFENYLYWEISKIGNSPITRMCVFLIDPELPFLHVNFENHPKSRWLLHKDKGLADRYKCIFYKGRNVLRKITLEIERRAHLEIRYNVLDIHPYVYEQGLSPEPPPFVAISHEATSSCSSPSERQFLAQFAMSSISSTSSAHEKSSSSTLKGAGSNLSHLPSSQVLRKRPSAALSPNSVSSISAEEGSAGDKRSKRPKEDRASS